MDKNQFEMYLINKIKFFFNGLMIMIQNDQIKIINLFANLNSLLKVNTYFTVSEIDSIFFLNDFPFYSS